MEYNTDHFLSMLAKMNISLSDKQLQQFMTYYEMLIEKISDESDCHYRF